MSILIRSVVACVALGLAAAPLSLAAQTSAPGAQGVSGAAGVLIDSQPLAAGFGLEGAGQAFAIRYTSTDGVAGSGTVPVTGALFIPKGTPPKGGCKTRARPMRCPNP